MDYELAEGPTERLVSICHQAGADCYVSGPSARAYLDEAAFEAAKIGLVYFDYAGYPEYPQLFPPFDHFVSVLDLIFNMGRAAPRYLLGVSDHAPVHRRHALSIGGCTCANFTHASARRRAVRRLRDRARQRRLAGRFPRPWRWNCSRIDPHVRIIDLARNFGHHKAMMTGLAHARGDLVFLIDSDLEEEPELLPSFVETLRDWRGGRRLRCTGAAPRRSSSSGAAAGCSSSCSICCRIIRFRRTCVTVG